MRPSECNASHAWGLSVSLLSRRTWKRHPFLPTIWILRRNSFKRAFNGWTSPALLGWFLIYEPLRLWKNCRRRSRPFIIFPQTEGLYELARLRHCPGHILLSQRSSYVLSWVVIEQIQIIPPVNLPLLHVELDPAVLNTSYGHLLKNDPSVVLRAMGVSLDKGMPITIKLADSSHTWDILFFATDATGKRHLLHTSKLRMS